MDEVKRKSSEMLLGNVFLSEVEWVWEERKMLLFLSLDISYLQMEFLEPQQASCGHEG